MARRVSRESPRDFSSVSITSSSAAMMPVKPPASTAMLVSVARSSSGRRNTPSPVNSSTLPMPWLVRKKGSAKSASMMSLAVVPAGSAPRRVTRTLSGTRTRTSSVNHALAMSVEPTPKAKQPSTPAMQVWLSVPTTTCPGSARSSTTALWQMASEPPRGDSPYRRSTCFSANSACVVASALALSSSPISMRAWGITSPMKVRWSRNSTTLSGWRSAASCPRAARKSASAMGVTYSCAKRRSVRTNSASPGATAGTPSVSWAASTTACRARIFSTMVMGRAGVVTGGGASSPARRARL